MSEDIQVVVTSSSSISPAAAAVVNTYSVPPSLSSNSTVDGGSGKASHVSPSTHRSSVVVDADVEQVPVSRRRPPGIGSRCLWDACRASLLGLLFLISGIVFALYEFRSHFATPDKMNATYEVPTVQYFGNPSANRQKVSYIGPILIGTGGFILIAVGVVTLEMRDLASKVFPQSTKRPMGPRPSKSKISQTMLVELFQTPTMKLVKELARRSEPRVGTVGTQTVRTSLSLQPPVPEPWHPLVTRQRRRMRSNGEEDAMHQFRSCHQLSTALHQPGQTEQLYYVFKRRHKQRKMRLLVHRKKFTWAVSCPHLNTVS